MSHTVFCLVLGKQILCKTQWWISIQEYGKGKQYYLIVSNKENKIWLAIWFSQDWKDQFQLCQNPLKLLFLLFLLLFLSKKSFCSKNNPCPKNIRPKSVGSKKNWVKKVSSKKALVQQSKYKKKGKKNLVRKNWESANF